MVKNVSVVVLNRFRRTRTPHSLISGGFRFRVTALRMDGRTDGQTDGRMDGRPDGRTDRPSYRDARTHLKRRRKQGQEANDASSILCILIWFIECSGGGVQVAVDWFY